MTTLAEAGATALFVPYPSEWSDRAANNDVQRRAERQADFALASVERALCSRGAAAPSARHLWLGAHSAGVVVAQKLLSRLRDARARPRACAAAAEAWGAEAGPVLRRAATRWTTGAGGCPSRFRRTRSRTSSRTRATRWSTRARRERCTRRCATPFRRAPRRRAWRWSSAARRARVPPLPASHYTTLSPLRDATADAVVYRRVAAQVAYLVARAEGLPRGGARRRPPHRGRVRARGGGAGSCVAPGRWSDGAPARRARCAWTRQAREPNGGGGGGERHASTRLHRLSVR